ncbi:PAS domain S-box protein, partial [Rhodobaculum claviforme]
MARDAAIRTRLARQKARLRQARRMVARSETMLRADAALRDAATPEAGIRAALEVLRVDLGADLAVLVRNDAQAGAVPLAVVPADAARADGRDGAHAPWPPAAAAVFAPRHATDLRRVGWRDALPGALTAAYRALICAPLAVPNEAGMALVMLAHRPAHFDQHAYRSLLDMAAMLAHALEQRRLRDRSAVFADLLAGGRLSDGAPDAPLDRAFHTVSRGLARVADWQSHVLAINGLLLTCATDEIDRVIDTVLARLGALTGVDRAYVFRRRADLLDNTHEWCAPGIAPMIRQLQDQPMALLDGHLAALLHGAPVQIPDLATLPEGSPARAVLEAQQIRSLLLVPFVRDGALRGFVGFDCVRGSRDFSTVEVQLLAGVATAVGAVLDRAEAEAALRRDRDQLRATFAAMPELVLELDANGIFTRCYAGTRTPTRLPPEKFLGRHFADVHPPDLVAVIRRLIAQADSGDGIDGVEFPVTVDGTRRWYHATAAARSQGPGGGGYVAVVRDVTNRHTAERQRRLLERASQVTPEAIVLADANRRIEWVNPAFERLTGWPLDAVRGRDPAEVLGSPATDRAEMARMVARVEARTPMQGEFIARTRAGEDIWLSVDVVPMLGPDGSFDGSIGVHRDITALKTSGERARRALLEGLDASVDAIGTTDVAGNFTYLNLAHREMFAIPATEPAGDINWSDLYDPERAAWLNTHAMPVLRRTGSWRGAVTGRRRDGREVQQDLSLSLQPDGGIMCISRDLTEQQRIAEERAGLREALQQAQQRDTVAQVAGGVAHDLNNLIAVIAGSLEVLEGTADAPDSPATPVLRRMRRAIETARTLTAGMARLGRADLPRGAQDLGRRLADAVDLLGSGRVSRHGVRVDLPDAPLTVWANPTELAQVVMNLALNACDSGTKDSPATVALTALPPGTPPPDRAPDAGTLPQAPVPLALFTVRDTGTGIPATVRPRLFERNYTTKGEAGTGLGLPIVAAILNDNHAALWVDTAPGAGTTMTVAWPIHPPDTAGDRIPGRAGLRLDAACTGDRVPGDLLSGLRVLVVDDLPDVAEVLAEMLEAAGAVAVAESDPHAAQDMLAEAPGLWSVLLSDLHMPGLDGLALARFAATLSPPVPTVIVTARPETLAHT